MSASPPSIRCAITRKAAAGSMTWPRDARALGWQEVVVIDEDLGKSGATTAGRTGFQRLVAEVSLGRAGAVVSLEVSRLARNNRDWHQLLELCGLTDTVIVDADGVYDPRLLNDRLLLGLKGTISEAELGWLRQRAYEGLLAKARRGELRLSLARRLRAHRRRARRKTSRPTGAGGDPPGVRAIRRRSAAPAKSCSGSARSGCSLPALVAETPGASGSPGGCRSTTRSWACSAIPSMPGPTPSAGPPPAPAFVDGAAQKTRGHRRPREDMAGVVARPS